MKTTRPHPLAWTRNAAPNFAQATGMIVTAIVVFGTKADVYTSMALGILAGAMATFFVTRAEHAQAAKKRS